MNLRLAELEDTVRTLQIEVAQRKESEQLLKEREQELLDFVENAAEGLHRVGPDGTILWANNAELNMLGYSREEYVGRHIAEFHVDAPVIESILTKLSAGETLYDQPARLRCKDGSIKQVHIYSNGCFSDNQLRHTRCFTRDATERIALEKAHAEREALLAELTEANRLKDEFLAMLAHELRNPLAPIAAAADLLGMVRLNEEKVRQTSDIISRQVRHMTGLVDDLLDVSRVTRGQVTLDKSQHDFKSVISSAIEQVRPLIESHRHHLIVDMAAEPGYVVGDHNRLVQIVANLLNNAAKYTPDGGNINLRMAVHQHEIALIVDDNGIGIEPELQSRIFDLFTQAERTVDRSQGGLGIGLALVKSLVEMHGGTVSCQSPGTGQGSRFTVTMPKIDHQDTRLDQDKNSRRAAEANRKMRLLVVDDNADAAQMLAMYLEAIGHEVMVEHSAKQALELTVNEKPDACILDIGLPGMDGNELARRIRSIPETANITLIAVTGYGQTQDRQETEAAGFDQHLVKPVDTRKLAKLLERLHLKI